MHGQSICVEAMGHVYKSNHHRHFNQGNDYSGEGLAWFNTEYSHGHRDGKLEVVAGGGKGERRALAVIDAEWLADEKGQEEHEYKVYQQRYGDPDHVTRQSDNIIAF